MILWNTNRLAIALAQRQLSPEQKSHYLFASCLLGVISTYIGAFIVTTPTGWLFIYEGFLVLVITYFGFIRCRENYQGALNDQFIENFIILGVPLIIKMIIFTWLAYLGIGQVLPWLISHFSFTSESSIAEIVIKFFLNPLFRLHPFLIATIASLGWYWRLSVHLKTIASGQHGT